MMVPGGRMRLALLVAAWCWGGFPGIAQPPVLVTDPEIELRDNVIHITYDLLANRSAGFFEVGVDIFDAKGNKIEANSLAGDLGKGVAEGPGKTIRWDLGRDRIVMREMIYFEVHARAMPQTELVQIGKSVDPEEAATEPIAGTGPAPSAVYSKTYSSAGIILQSLLIPGLGLSRVTGNPHWVRAVAGYGCLAGSVVLNHQSMVTYRGIEEITDFDKRVAQLQKSVTQDDISELLAIAGIGIWATDLIWNIVGISSFKKRSAAHSGKFSVKPGVDPLSFRPTVGFKYRF